MHTWKVWLGITFLASCGHLNVKSRSVASLSPELIEMAPAVLARETQAAYENLHYLRLNAYEALDRFDEHLRADAPALIENPAYPELLAARMQIEGSEHEIHERRAALTSVVTDEEAHRSERLKADAQLRALLPLAGQTQGPWIHTLRELHDEGARWSRFYLMAQEQVSDPVVKQQMEATYAAAEAVYDGYRRAPKGGDFLPTLRLERGRVDIQQKLELGRKSIEHHAFEIKSQLEEVAREKKSGRFQPSTGGSGNIVGTEFPAKVWSLTFDDGPGGASTRAVVDNLKTHGLKATFFQLTQMAQTNRTNAQYVRDNGMEIACHSYNHPQMNSQAAAGRDRQIRQASQELSALHGGRPIRFFRLPYGQGVGVADIRQRIASAGMIHVFWNVDTLDWQAQPAANIIERTRRQMASSPRDAGVILFHDVHLRTVEASEAIMRHLKTGGRRVCTLGEIVDQTNRGEVVCPARQ
jgi:peptidoglycan/xylan/chitin deacetylase (PgdA/CDA1 family)